jgi:hypothetical protein
MKYDMITTTIERECDAIVGWSHLRRVLENPTKVPAYDTSEDIGSPEGDGVRSNIE